MARIAAAVAATPEPEASPAGPDLKSDTAIKNLKVKMREYLAAQPKVSVKCNRDAYVAINGLGFLVRGGERVSVPEPIYNLLDAGGYC